MAEGFNGIIAQLERQKTAIDRALAALRDVDGTQEAATEATATTELASSAPATRKGGMTPEGRKRLSAALKKRWAAKKGAQSAPAAVPQKTPARKVSFTPEGRKRLAEAMRRRWAVKRAGSAVKKAGRKSAA
jgi:hypothetical protein